MSEWHFIIQFEHGEYKRGRVRASAYEKAVWALARMYPFRFDILYLGEEK